MLALGGAALYAQTAEAAGALGGYAEIQAGTKAYSDQAGLSEAGVFPRTCVVFFEPAGDGWVKAAFTLKGGKAPVMVFVRAEEAEALSAAREASLKDALTRSGAARLNGWTLPAVSFTAFSGTPGPAATPSPVPGGTEETSGPSASPAPATAAPETDVWAAFTGGYVTVPAGETAFRSPSSGGEAGCFPKTSTVCALPSGRGWVEAAFRDADTKRTTVVYLRTDGLSILSSAEAASLKTALSRTGAPKYEGMYLNTVRFSISSAVPAATAAPAPTKTPAATGTPAAATPTPAATKAPSRTGLAVLVTVSSSEPAYGETVTLTARVQGGTGTTVFQWQRAAEGSDSFAEVPGGRGAVLELTADPETAGWRYRCLAVRNQKAVWSEPVSFVCRMPSVTVQASAASAYAGEKVWFTASAEGLTGEIYYEWQQSPDGEEWAPVGMPGADTAELTFEAAAERLSLLYRCRVSAAGGEWFSQAVSIRLEEPAAPVYRALLIGQSDYTGSYAALPGCRNDVVAMRGMLTGLTNGYSVTVAANQTAGQIRSAVRSAFRDAKEQDVSLVYYSGHGSADSGTGHGALMGVDGSMITTAELAGLLGSVSGRIIVILDSCYSGAAIQTRGEVTPRGDQLSAFLKNVIADFSGAQTGGIRKRSGELAVPKFIVLAAARYSEISGEGTLDGYRCGVFTYSLLKGLGCVYPDGAYTGAMPADNGDLEVTLEEIYRYAYQEANRIFSVQHVVYYGGGAEVLFSRRVNP